MTRLPAEGEPAPDFTLDTDEGTITLSALRGRKAVVYFYPKDDTSGCTREAIDFTTLAEAFRSADTEVIGISADSVDSHGRFRAKHGLAVTLASDTEHDAISKYGVWVEKSMYGRKYMGIERTTFLIDEKGVIRQIWPKVSIPGHIEEVLTATRAI